MALQKNNQPDDYTFRRKEDKIKYELTNKIVGIVKWLIAVNVILLYFFYSVATDNKELSEYQIKVINNLSQKVEKIANMQYQSTPETKRNTNFAFDGDKLTIKNLSYKNCSSCHNTKENYIYIQDAWVYEDFKRYVRGDKRVPKNSVMPLYSAKEISDRDLELLYFELLKNKQQ